MIKVRKALDADKPAITRIINQLDLTYPSQTLDNFWVAEDKTGVVGIAALWEYRNFYYLSSVGVAADRQHEGIATKLLNKLLTGLRKDTYLFTITPDFFARFGFAVTSEPPKGLPPRTIFACDRCRSELCVCMRRPAA